MGVLQHLPAGHNACAAALGCCMMANRVPAVSGAAMDPLADPVLQCAAPCSAGSSKQHGSTTSRALTQPATVGFGPWTLLWTSSAPNTAWDGRDDIELGARGRGLGALSRRRLAGASLEDAMLVDVAVDVLSVG